MPNEAGKVLKRGIEADRFKHADSYYSATIWG